MGSTAKDSLGAKGRADLMLFDPNDLTIVTDPSHPLYDERVTLPLDESLVLNIMLYGVLEPIIVRKNGEAKGKPIIEVADGRQRTIATREANKRIAKAGGVLLRIPATVKRTDDKTLAGIMVSTNEQRTADEPIVQAKKAQRLLDRGHTKQEVAGIFRWSQGTLTNRLALLDCAPEVQAAIGVELTAGDARALAKLPRERQKTELKAMRAAGGPTRAAVAKVTGTKARPVGTSRRKIVDLAVALENAMEYAENGGEKRRYKFAAACLRYALGEGDMPEVPRVL